MGHLRLAFLGVPEVRHSDRLLRFRTRKALALLVYLTVEAGLHSREKLAALFWPESDDARARMMLRSTLRFLRQALAIASEQASDTHLLVEGDSLGFNLASEFDLDLYVLQSAWRLCRSHKELPSANSGVIVQLQAAAHQYRGDFLDGFTLRDASDFDNWESVQREIWHRRMSLVFDRLSQAQFESGELAIAIDSAARWVTHDPLNEGAHRRLMQLYFANGDRAAALQAYAACQAILGEELNTEPAPETQALVERLRMEAPPEREPRVGEPIIPMITVEGPLVGRVPEHTRLVAAYQMACLGRTQVVTLEGEPGIGKTRLATEFLRWAMVQGADVLQGRAFEAGGDLPYHPLLEALRGRLAHEKRLDELLSEVWWAELNRLLPELRDYYRDLPLPLQVGEAEARTRLFEAFARLGQALARRSPVVLFVDDLQWGDAASLDLLRYATRRWAVATSPLMLLLSFRVEALGKRRSLVDWLAGLEREIGLTRLTLGPLTYEDTLRLVQELRDDHRHPLAKHDKRNEQEDRTATDSRQAAINQFGQWLFGETRGQPLFITETLKSLFERRLLQVNEAGAIDFETAMPLRELQSFLPAGVQEVIRTRLAHLSDSGRVVLAAGAVLGHGSDFEHLGTVANVGEDEMLSALDELLVRRLLREANGSYWFTHDKIRQVAYAEAGERRRRVFHRRAFYALQAGSGSPAELARHACAARLAEQAFQLSVVAGDEAMRLFAVRDAITHYEQARRMATEQRRRDKQWAASHSELLHLSVQLGRAYELNNRFEQARATYHTLLAFAKEAREPGAECMALNRLATLTAQESSDGTAAMALLQEAKRVAEHSGDKLGLVETEWNLAQMGIYAWEPAVAITHGERALALAQELNLQELIARSLNALSFGEIHAGQWMRAETHAQEACRQYALLGNRAMEADSLCLVGEARVRSGQPTAGLIVLRTAHTISLEIENVWGQANSAYNLTLALLEVGDYSEALKMGKQAVTAARALDFSPLLLLSLVALGAVYRALLQLEAACTIHLEALQISETLGPQFYVECSAAELCADYALAGDWAHAYTFARQALLARRSSTVGYVGLTRWHETAALLWGGDIASAQEDVQRFGNRVEDSPRYRIPYLRALAVLAGWHGKIDEATDYLWTAASLAQDIDLPGELWQIQAALGELHRARSDERQAHRAFASAAEIVQQLAGKIEDEDLRGSFSLQSKYSTY